MQITQGISAKKMLIIVFVVDNKEEVAVVLNEGCASESPGGALIKHVLNLAISIESELRF